MTRNPVLALCLAFALTFVVCTNTAVAQSAPPTTKPSLTMSPRALLQQSIDSQQREADVIRRDLHEIAAKQVEIAKELTESKSVEEKSGVSIESFPEIVKNLQARRIELIIDLAGLEAKREAIVAARLARPDNSAIVAPLRKIVALQQDNLDRLRKTKAPTAELRKAEMELLSSKVQLANAESPRPGSTLLTDALLTTSLAQAESKARLAKTESLLGEILPTRKQLESSTRLKAKATRLLEVETDLAKQLRAANRTVELLSAELKQMKDDNAQ